MSRDDPGAQRPRDPRRPRPGVVRDPSAAEDVEREIQAHLALRTEELVERGWDPGEARAEALRLFGDREAVARAATQEARRHERARRRSKMMETVWQDIRYGIRSLTGSPGFAAVALLTLALGIGANTAIFSVVDGVLLEPLPYDDPQELLWLDEETVRGTGMAVAWVNHLDWREATVGSELKGLAAFGVRNPTVVGGPEPVQIAGATVSQDFWRVFPVAPLAGRTTLPEDHLRGAAPVLVVSRSLARDVLGAVQPADAVGQTLELGGRAFQVVGVVADDFDFPSGARHWGAAELGTQSESRTSHNWAVVARMAPTATRAGVEERLDAVQQRLIADVPADAMDYAGVGVNVLPLQEEIVGEVRTPLLILLGAAVFVLLVACTNLASTLLARGTVRAREMAVRSALGGSRGRLIRQLLTESVLLSLVGAGAGVGLAAAALGILRRLGAGAVPRLEGVALDGPVLAFTVVVAVGTALAFGLLPALRGSEGAQADALRTDGRGTVGRRRATWDVLVAAEVALALVLLAGSGLLVRSFVAVLDEDPGFQAADVTTARVSLSSTRYPEDADHVRFWDAVLERGEALPGVAGVGILSNRPLSNLPNGRLALDGDPEKYGDAGYIVASAGAFEALDVPLLQGRLFDERDGPDAPHVVVVSRSFADTYWPGEDPLGRRVTGGGMDRFWNADPPVWGTVVGVVGEVRYRDLERSAEPTVYWHYRQRPGRIQFGASVFLEAGSGDPSSVAGPLRTLLQEADPEIPVQLQPMSEVVRASVGERRFMLFILGSFAALALVLAGVGIYGVVSYSVARRTREMGVRLALGADPESVRSLVLRGALRPGALGLVLGVVGALVLTRVLAGLETGLLYRVAPTDPLTYGGVTVALLLVGVVASWVPAYRGTRVDPMITMRAE